ncbi:hypothetical protein BDN71DRAFT_1590199 [Pleurotus eryngii]|uniref:Uncharacterized protein n=1 Tax=Pleurotus eryngii TaxID=5323 RepID=A0A9P6DFK6_PLEER|nr:hypothetical protein BDN71DRAFT_1590199 [Pleurotus eryngii]
MDELTSCYRELSTIVPSRAIPPSYHRIHSTFSPNRRPTPDSTSNARAAYIVPSRPPPDSTMMQATFAWSGRRQPRLRHLPPTPALIRETIVPPRVDLDFISPLLNLNVPDAPDRDIHGDILDTYVHALAPRILLVSKHDYIPPVPPSAGLEGVCQRVPVVAAPVIARDERLEHVVRQVLDEDVVADILGIQDQRW